jgi:hypothetical protein
MSFYYQDAENFINDTFWSESNDPRSKLDLPALITQRLIADDKEKDPEYYNHREGVVHATSLSKCLRGVIHEMLQHPKDSEMEPRKLGIFKAGNLFEDFVLDCLRDKVIHKQREYEYQYKGITLVGRSDYTILDEGIMRVGENKSVHSESFWMRKNEGTIVAWQNLVQLQIYMWLERELNGNEWEGIFSYVSKDDTTVIGAPIKYNRRIIDEVVIPALDIIAEGYARKDPNFAPLPPLVVFSKAKHMYQKNWLASYCEHHKQCAGEGWFKEATNIVTQRNREMAEAVKNKYETKPAKAVISVVK